MILVSYIYQAKKQDINIDVKLGNLIEKIKSGGIEQAKQTADEILREAKEELDSTLQDSRKNVRKIAQNIQKEAVVFEGKSKIAMQRVAWDIELLAKEKLTDLFTRFFKKMMFRSSLLINKGGNKKFFEALFET